MGIHDNNMNKQQTQKRVILATVISFVFFIAYDYLYLQPQHIQKQQKQEQQQTQQVQEQASPQAQNNSAPQASSLENSSQGEDVAAPLTQDVIDSKVIATIKTQNNIFKIDDLGRLLQVTLKQAQYVQESGEQIDLFDSNQLRPWEVRFADRKLNKIAFDTPVEATQSQVDATNKKQTLTLTQDLKQSLLTKKITFYPDGHYDLQVSVTNDKSFFITPGFRPDVLADMYADHGALLKLNDNTLTIIEDGDLDNTQSFTGIKIASAFDRYYATVLYNINKSMAVSLMPDSQENPQIFIHGKQTLDLHGYAGPKDYDVLHSLNPELTDVIEYGWFTFLAKPMFVMLKYIYDIVGNWGWTIVILTLLVKLILYPLSYKGMVSMQKLKDLAPKIKEIQTKYKGDPQKSSAHMMELYKKHGANPMGGCLPILLQIPVFFAIYRVLLNAIELKGADWILWIDDLAEMDPYFILPILMGATMFLQQKITPNTIQDEMQKKMFQWLPVVFTFFFLWFPAGLTLYWFINNLFTVAQQYYINKIFEKKKSLQK